MFGDLFSEAEQRAATVGFIRELTALARGYWESYGSASLPPSRSSQQQRRCTGRCDSPAAAGQGVQLIDQQGIGPTKLPTAALRAPWLAASCVLPLPRSCERMDG